MAVYSTQLLQGLVAAGADVTYTVPEGFVVVLRDMEFAYPPGSSAEMVIILNGAAFQAHISSTATTDISWQWAGRAVLEAGDVLEVYSSNQSIGILLSGYLLTA